MKEQLKAHELAKLLLNGPNLEVAINYDGEYNGRPRRPEVVELANREKYVVIDPYGGELPQIPIKDDKSIFPTAEPREVKAGHGHRKAMSYRFRCRIESRTRTWRTWFGFGEEKSVTEWRWVLEKKHIEWGDEGHSVWMPSKQRAQRSANRELDAIEAKPEGDYA